MLTPAWRSRSKHQVCKNPFIHLKTFPEFSIQIAPRVYFYYSQRHHPVEELRQAAFQLLDLEPIGVERHHVWRSILFVVPVEVLLQPIEHLFGIVIVKNALIQVGTVPAFVTLHVVRVQGQLPNTCDDIFFSLHSTNRMYRTKLSIRDSVTLERLGGTGAGLAFVRDLVVESVRPNRHPQRRDAYAAVVYISEVLEHLVLGVATGFQIGRPHADHLAGRDVAEVLQYLAHSDHLADPLLVTLVLQALL